MVWCFRRKRGKCDLFDEQYFVSFALQAVPHKIKRINDGASLSNKKKIDKYKSIGIVEKAPAISLNNSHSK